MYGSVILPLRGSICICIDPTPVPSHLWTIPPPSALSAVPLINNLSHHDLSEQPMSPRMPLHAQLTPPGQQPSPTTQPVSSAGVSLSPASEPFPRRIADRICSGQFVEMRDLLTDNISLLHQLEAVNGQHPLPSLLGTLRPRLRDVTSLSTWLYCYMAYVAIRSTDPLTRDMLAYGRLLIRESQRHGGNGWLDYDRVFRQQVAIDPSLRWNTLHPGIQASTLVTNAPGPGTFCTLCRENDHGIQQCALTYFNQSAQHSWPVPAPPRFRTQPPRRPESLQRICVSWNKGSCVYPGTCSFQHICATCHQRHMAKDCGSTPSDSEYKRNFHALGRRKGPK